MGESVERVVAGYLEELGGRPGRGGKPVTFSIRLNEREHARLVWLAGSLGTQKTPLAEKLLRAAVDEAVRQYAGWASPEDPEGFLEEAWGSMEGGEDPAGTPGGLQGRPRGPAGGPRKKPPPGPGPKRRR